MNQSRQSIATLCVALATATVLAACGSSANNTTTAPKSAGTSSSSAGDTRTPAQLAADKKLAQKASFVLSDFPDGWEAKPDDNSSTADDERAVSALAGCLHIDPSFVGQSDKSDDSFTSPDFDAPEGDETVSSNVGVTQSAAQAAQTVQAFAQPSAPACLGSFFNAEIAASIAKSPGDLQGAKIGKVTVGQVNFPTLNDRTVALRFDVPISAKGLSIDAYLDLVIIQQGRSGALLTFQDLGSPFPTDDAVKYAKVVADRMAALPLQGNNSS